VPALEKLDLVDFDRYMNVHTSAEPQHKAELWGGLEAARRPGGQAAVAVLAREASLCEYRRLRPRCVSTCRAQERRLRR